MMIPIKKNEDFAVLFLFLAFLSALLVKVFSGLGWDGPEELMSGPYPLELFLPLFLVAEIGRLRLKQQTEINVLLRHKRFSYAVRAVCGSFLSGVLFSFLYRLFAALLLNVPLSTVIHPSWLLSGLLKGLYLMILSMGIEILRAFRIPVPVAAGILFITAALDYIVCIYTGMGETDLLYPKAFRREFIPSDLYAVIGVAAVLALGMIFIKQFLEEYLS